LETIKVTKMHEKYYTPEQLETLKQRGEAMGPEGMQKAQADWAELNAEFRSAMKNGINPAADEVQALVVRMKEMIHAFTGGDAGIARSLGNMYKTEGAEKASRGAIEKALADYMGKARAIAEGG
ncbi:MAG: TipAS antibiotic-recognition domain-containing protein, partial [Bacteroidota bacterium]